MNAYILKILIAAILSIGITHGKLPAIFSTLESRLNEISIVNEEDSSLGELKDTSVNQNIDIELSHENYFKAKREVNIARSQFSPFSTGQALGMSLGLNYLWEAVITEAILSIPMKAFNVKSKKYIRKAQYYNYKQMQESIENDMAHLYYDILIHEMVLKTIDLEAELITSFYQDRLTEQEEETQEQEEERIALETELNKRLLYLGIERLDIEMLYVKELEAFRNLLAISFDTPVDSIAPVESVLDLEKIKDIDVNSLKHDSLYKNSKFLFYANLTAAYKAKVKSTKWSIITFGGLRFSYGKRVRLAEAEHRQAQLRENSEARKVRVNLIGSYDKLLSSTQLSKHHSSIYNQSLALFNEVIDNNEYGLISDDNALRISLDLLSDYRDFALAKYKSLSSFDDFNFASKASLDISGFYKH